MCEVLGVGRHRLTSGFDAEPGHFGKLPEPAIQPAGGAPREEPAFTDDDPGDVDLALGDGAAGAWTGQLLLASQGAGAAHLRQGADQAAGPARRADGRAEIHEALVVVAGRRRRDRSGGEIVQVPLAGGRGGVV